jgi:PAS domain S-box-containing protein
MIIRKKAMLFTVAILVTTLVLAAGAFYIISMFGENLDILINEVQKDKLQDDLANSVLAFMEATKGWAATRDSKYKRRYAQNLLSVNESLDKLRPLVKNKTAFALFEKECDELVMLSKAIMSVSREVSTRELSSLIRMLEVQESAVFSRKNELHKEWMKSALDVLGASRTLRINLTFYFTLLIAFSLASLTFLVLMMKRVIEEPYNTFLDATEKVAAGDLGYRIGTEREDEFGLISNRFDVMVESLQSSDGMLKGKLRETELLLDVSQIAGKMPELKEALDLMAETVAAKMEKDICAVFLYEVEKGEFRLESCNRKNVPIGASLPVDSSVAEKTLNTLKPFIADKADKYPEITSICDETASFMAVPIIRDQSCVGILLLGSDNPGGIRPEEMDTATIVAHTIGAALRSKELYDETKKQLSQLSIVYELSKSLTTVYETDELLSTISSEIVKLINAKGCVIRLVEDGVLKVRSCSGRVGDLARAAELPIGKGIAGWVAKEGRSLFVEDISKMPEDMRIPGIIAKSAISVPLKKDGTVLGTLGLYDKLDEKGETIPFAIDDLNVAEGFASISSVAIDKAVMKQQEVKIKARIEEAKKRMDLLFESVQSGIITLDKAYNITAANRYVERWVDKPLEDIISHDAMEVFHKKGGICPHCAAKATFEEGSVNTITQSSGLNYADLASYPVRDKDGDVSEAVVIIQDITDRVLYQEEIMGLYREVMQTKEYMESLINNSADAIVTSDLDGKVNSWNPAAETIFGYKKEEVLGKFLPFVPESLLEFEKGNIEKIRNGEVLKLETYRKRKDGTIIEVSLALSPIKDIAGDIIGITGITRDITDKKRVEKELIRRNQELSRLFFISSAMRGTFELDRLLRMVLTAVTMSDGLGFNRALLFFLDEEEKKLKGEMGVGPSSLEEAWHIWEGLSVKQRSLQEIMRDIEEGPLKFDSFLNRLSTALEIPLSEDTILAKVAVEKKAYNVTDVREEKKSDVILIQQLGTEAYAAVPLVYRDKVIGALWVDNLFNKRQITGEDMKFLVGFADQVASAIEAARLFQKVSLAEAELENIFRSISDMVFITDEEYTIKNVNQAVANRIGMTGEEIVGRKCYQVFHGMDEPWPLCPHHRTMETKKSYVEELEDPHLDGTFLTSTSPVFDPDSNFLGTVHVVRDITELKALRERLQSSERKAALGEVAAKVAHEIRNPLVSVGGFAKRLESKLEGNLKDYARIISSEVNRLENILKDILGFVREVRISMMQLDLNEIVNDILELLGPEFSERGNNVIKELHEPAVMVFIDPNRIREAVLNIIANANQSTEEGVVTVRTGVEEGFGLLDVSDTGCGIRKEDIDHIFDPFYTTRPMGTGLGLAIAKRIIEEHEGKITVESNAPGRGTRFKIYLPLKEV